MDYFQFVLNCQHALLSLNSHKLAWAASLLCRLAGPEPQYLNAIATITDQFIKQQDNQGLWYTVDHYKAPFLRNIEKFYTRQIAKIIFFVRLPSPTYKFQAFS